MQIKQTLERDTVLSAEAISSTSATSWSSLLFGWVAN